MMPEQEDHIQSIVDRFAVEADRKYRKGQAEHGGNLWDLPSRTLLDFAIEETIDQFIYLTTLKDKLRRSDAETRSESGASDQGVAHRDGADLLDPAE